MGFEMLTYFYIPFDQVVIDLIGRAAIWRVDPVILTSTRNGLAKMRQRASEVPDSWFIRTTWTCPPPEPIAHDDGT
jgi:hypothetical protein